MGRLVEISRAGGKDGRVNAPAGYALVLQLKPFAEGGCLATLFCRERGLVKGLIKGAKRLHVLPMDEVGYTHYRRLESQLGTLAVEPALSRAALTLGSRKAGALGQYVAEMLTRLLPEEHPYPLLWEDIQALLGGPGGWRDVARFERGFLSAIGYGLPLADDAVPCPDGAPLTYVSPVSGRAISAVMGAPYVGRLLVLPQLWGGPETHEAGDCEAALGLTGFFVRRAAAERKLPARAALVRVLEAETVRAVAVAV